LLEEALAPDAVFDQAGRGAERSERLRVLVRARVAGDDDELRDEQRVCGVDDRAAGGDQSGRLALPARCLPRSLRREEIEVSPDDEQLPNQLINFDAAIRSADAGRGRAI